MSYNSAKVEHISLYTTSHYLWMGKLIQERTYMKKNVKIIVLFSTVFLTVILCHEQNDDTNSHSLQFVSSLAHRKEQNFWCAAGMTAVLLMVTKPVTGFKSNFTASCGSYLRELTGYLNIPTVPHYQIFLLLGNVLCSTEITGDATTS